MALLDTAFGDAQKHIDDLLLTVKSESASVDSSVKQKTFEDVCKYLQVQWFVLGKKGLQTGGEAEAVLEKLVLSLEILAENGDMQLRQMESFLTRFTEQILLDEAKGIYRFGVSENNVWIQLPLLSTQSPMAKKQGPVKREADKLFKAVPELDWLDFTKNVPFVQISFVDVQKLAQGKKISAVKPTNSEEYYWRIF